MARERSASIQTDATFMPMKQRSGIFFRAQAALSSLSKPAESWGVSDVPVLSLQVAPRRSRASHLQTRWKSASPPKSTCSHLAGTQSRVSPIRPLSIATVSTFGAWMMSDHNGQLDDAEDQQVVIEPRSSRIQHTTSALEPREHKHLSSSALPNLRTTVHPLRMHPPSPIISLTGRATSIQQDERAQSRSPSLLQAPPTPVHDDAASKTSYGIISTRRSRPALAELNTNVTKSSFQLTSEHQEMVDCTNTSMASVAEQVPAPRDVGFVKAMRLWYEEKENEAHENQTCRQRKVKGVKTANCAMSGASAVQRL